MRCAHSRIWTLGTSDPDNERAKNQGYALKQTLLSYKLRWRQEHTIQLVSMNSSVIPLHFKITKKEIRLVRKLHDNWV